MARFCTRLIPDGNHSRQDYLAQELHDVPVKIENSSRLMHPQGQLCRGSFSAQ